MCCAMADQNCSNWWKKEKKNVIPHSFAQHVRSCFTICLNRAVTSKSIYLHTWQNLLWSDEVELFHRSAGVFVLFFWCSLLSDLFSSPSSPAICWPFPSQRLFHHHMTFPVRYCSPGLQHSLKRLNFRCSLWGECESDQTGYKWKHEPRNLWSKNVIFFRQWQKVGDILPFPF